MSGELIRERKEILREALAEILIVEDDVVVLARIIHGVS